MISNRRQRRTRGDDGHVDENMRVNLPVEQRLPDVAHFKVLLFADGRIVVLYSYVHVSGRAMEAGFCRRTLPVYDIRPLFQGEEARGVREVHEDYKRALASQKMSSPKTPTGTH